MSTGFKVMDVSLSRTPWVNVYGENKEVVAQWLLDNPYTGPATAHDETDEWVHYPNGYLKVRYRSTLGTAKAQMACNYCLSAKPASLCPSHHVAETIRYGVRYQVPAEVFSSAESVQAFVAERVSEFIENRDAYAMTNGQYHQGKS